LSASDHAPASAIAQRGAIGDYRQIVSENSHTTSRKSSLRKSPLGPRFRDRDSPDPVSASGNVIHRSVRAALDADSNTPFRPKAVSEIVPGTFIRAPFSDYSEIPAAGSDHLAVALPINVS